MPRKSYEDQETGFDYDDDRYEESQRRVRRFRNNKEYETERPRPRRDHYGDDRTIDFDDDR